MMIHIAPMAFVDTLSETELLQPVLGPLNQSGFSVQQIHNLTHLRFSDLRRNLDT